MVGGRPFAVPPGGRRCGHLERSSTPTRTSPRARRPTQDPVDAGAASDTLSALERAVRRGDRSGRRGPRSGGRRRRGPASWRRSSTTPRRSSCATSRCGTSTRPARRPADGTWAAAVDVTWRFAGFDEAASRAEVTVRFRGDGDRVDVVGSGEATCARRCGCPGRSPSGGHRDTLVVDAGPAGRAAEYERQARTAVADVRAVLPQWQTGLVVEVPADAAGLDAALGRRTRRLRRHRRGDQLDRRVDAPPTRRSTCSSTRTSTTGSGRPGRRW